jgi:glutathione S-transferase
MPDLILHHYPASPLSEKIRVILGLKKLSWCSVEIPNLPPKPDVMPLTGGYRRTPIMQIGADVFCDSQRILSELECRKPSEANNTGLVQIINRWCDDLFHPVVKVAITASSNELPNEFLEDRRKLFLNDYSNIESAKARIPYYTEQVRAQLAQAEISLKEQNGFLISSSASIADASLFALTWFIRRRWKNGAKFLEGFPNICRWEESIKRIGHGTPTDMASEKALDIAKETETNFKAQIDADDIHSLSTGDRVSITPKANTGEKGVRGSVHIAEKNRISVLHKNDRVGTICIHFPKIGYVIERV